MNQSVKRMLGEMTKVTRSPSRESILLLGIGSLMGCQAEVGTYAELSQALSSVPARIQAQDFDAASDTTGGNTGGECTSSVNGDVDMQSTGDSEGGTCNIGWTAPGEWVEYDITVDQAGDFDVALRLAARTSGRQVSLALDGEHLGTVAAPSNGWQSYEDRTLADVSIAAGSHTLRVTFDDGDTNLNYLDVTGGGGSGSAVSLPATIEAEDFVAFNDSTPGHSGDCGSGPVDQETTSDQGGGCNVGWTAAGEWLEYEVQVDEAGDFDAALRLAANSGGKRVQLSVDGNVLGTVTSPGAGWQSWETRVISDFALSAGQHTVRATFLDGLTNLNWIDFAEADDGGLPPGTHPDIVAIIDVPGRNPGGVGWMDSYSVGDRCYCDSTFDHDIGGIIVSTPAGNRTVRQVCDALGAGPGRSGRPIYNDIQCGNGPANDAGDEDDCPGRVDIGREGCGHIGPQWNFDGVSL